MAWAGCNRHDTFAIFAGRQRQLAHEAPVVGWDAIVRKSIYTPSAHCTDECV